QLTRRERSCITYLPIWPSRPKADSPWILPKSCTSFSITLSLPLLFNRTYVRGIDSFAARMIVATIESITRCRLLLAGNHCAISSTGLRNSPPEKFARCSRKDLRENWSGREAENVVVEILQTFLRVCRLSHREKKSPHNNAMWLRREWDSNPR